MRRLKVIRRWLQRRFGYARLACLALLIGFAALRVLDPAPVEELRVRTFDGFQRFDPRDKTARPVTIVDIDDKSLEKLGQWPWPRTRIADLVNELTRLGAVVIAFDVVFSEPDRLNPDAVADTLRNIDEATRERLRALPSNDQVLADAIRASRVVLGESGLTEEVVALDKSLPTTGLAMLGEEPQRFMFHFAGLLRNTPVLEHAAAGRGLFTIHPERDGIVRRVPMIMQAQGQTMPSLTFEILRVATGSGTILIKAEKAGIKSLAVKGFALPTDANGQLWIHYARNDPSLYISAINVLERTVAPDKIAGKLVLIGTSAVGLNDIKTTPVSPAMPGVEIHAQVLESALTGEVISQPNYGIVIEFATALLFGLLVIAFAPMFGPVTLVALGAVFATGLIGTSLYFYSLHRLLIDFTYPLMSTTSIYLTLIFSSFVREQQQRKQIRSQFAQYMSPALVAQLAQSPEKLVLGGEEREMTIMFSDIRGFTSISETYKHDPQGLTALMNSFLTPLTNAILARKGTIDKYMGDAIMAFWNAPLDDQEHQLNACEAAIDMLEKIDELNQEREQQAKDDGTAFIPDQCRCRSEHRALRRRQHGFRHALQLFGARRQRQSGVAARRAIQGIRISDHRRLEDRACGQGEVRDPRTRLHHGQGQEGARGDLRHRRARGHRAVRPLPAAAQPHHRDAGLLSQPRLGRRAGRDRTWPPHRRGAFAGAALQICTKCASAAIRKTRRRKTGTAPTRC